MNGQSAENDAPEWLAAAVGVMRDKPCENYNTPGQDCITAGREVFAIEACAPCATRAATRVIPPEAGDQ